MPYLVIQLSKKMNEEGSIFESCFIPRGLEHHYKEDARTFAQELGEKSGGELFTIIKTFKTRVFNFNQPD